MTLDLFDADAPMRMPLADGAVVLRGFALPHESALRDALRRAVPARHRDLNDFRAIFACGPD